MPSEEDLHDAELYRALMKKDTDEVLRIYNKFPKGAFDDITVHQDTILHMALHSSQVQLVLQLLRDLPTDDVGKIRTSKNNAGNTLLHEAATSDGLLAVAKMIISLNPDSLFELNQKSGERALYRAVRYGQVTMFKFLDSELIKRIPNEDDRLEFYKNEESTILHQAIINGHYDLALWIAKKHGRLINKKDKYEMSGLQHLARNPLAFKHKGTKCLKPLIYSGNTNEERAISIEEVESCCYVPKWEEMKNKMNRYESALELAQFLVEEDTSWKYTESVEEEQKHGDLIDEKKKNIEDNLTPLFLATKHGNEEIVKEILSVYPQAVEHIDKDGNTILHIAIKYGNIEVLDMVEKMEVPMRRLIKKANNDSNSILHMVGEKNANAAAEDKTESPAIQLQKNLQLYERVEKLCSAHFFNHLNRKGKTAEQVFAQQNKELHKTAQKWLKDTAQNCSLVAVLIATVAFAAAYTVPGGSKSDTGTPVLLHQTFFVIFTISDVLSLTFTLTSVIIFLAILTSPFRLKDFKNSLPQQLMLGVTFLIFSVSMMMLAFAATIILMIRNRDEWKKIALYTVAFLPVCVFAISYMPLYLSLMETHKYNLRKIWGFSPKFRFMDKIN